VASQRNQSQREPARSTYEVEKSDGFTRKNGDGRNADRRLANRRLQPLGHLTVREFPLRILRIRFARIDYCRASVPTSVPKPTRGVPQISIADDIIAIENAARLVTAQFHRDGLRNAGADHVPDGGPAEFVRDAAGATGRDPGATPRVIETARRDRMP
jgi:hypothetical protein